MAEEKKATVTAEKTSEKTSKRPSRKKKKAAVSSSGKAFIQATFNNTIVSITEPSGAVVAWASAGSKGFKGTRKSTPYAAQVASSAAATKALELGVKEVEVYVKGIGVGRDSAIRALATAGLGLISISDVTPIPHNGCRAAKPRRV